MQRETVMQALLRHTPRLDVATTRTVCGATL